MHLKLSLLMYSLFVINLSNSWNFLLYGNFEYWNTSILPSSTFSSLYGTIFLFNSKSSLVFFSFSALPLLYFFTSSFTNYLVISSTSPFDFSIFYDSATNSS